MWLIWTLKVLHCIGRTQVCVISQPIDWCHVSCVSLPAVGWYPMCRTLTVELQVFQYLLVWCFRVFLEGVWLTSECLLRCAEVKKRCLVRGFRSPWIAWLGSCGLAWIHFLRENGPPWTMTPPLKTDTQPIPRLELNHKQHEELKQVVELHRVEFMASLEPLVFLEATSDRVMNGTDFRLLVDSGSLQLASSRAMNLKSAPTLTIQRRRRWMPTLRRYGKSILQGLLGWSDSEPFFFPLWDRGHGVFFCCTRHSKPLQL